MSAAKTIKYPDPYPLYWQPDEFKHEFDHERTKEMAKRHFDWFVSSCYGRIPILLEYFSESLAGDHRADVFRLAPRVVSGLKLPWSTADSPPLELKSFYGDSTFIDQGRGLTPRSRSMAIDLGILTARAMQQLLPDKLEWHLATKPKQGIDFQSAVLQCTQDLRYEPKGWSIATLSGVLRGTTSTKSWLEIIDYFKDKCVD